MAISQYINQHFNLEDMDYGKLASRENGDSTSMKIKEKDIEGLTVGTISPCCS